MPGSLIDPVHAVARTNAWRSALVPAVLALLVVAAFARACWNDFTYDDIPTLVDNPAVRRGAPLGAVLSDPSTHAAIQEAVVYRPLRTLWFQLVHAIAGADPRVFHALGLALHFGVAMLVWRLLRRVLGEPRAALAAGVFACHPLLAEVVVSVKAEDDLLAAFGLLSACIVFDAGIDRTRESRLARAAPILVPLLFAAALLAKESALALPGLLAGIWIVRAPAGAAWRDAPKGLFGALGAIAVAYVAARQAALSAVAHAPASEPALVWLFPSSLAYAPLLVSRFVWPTALSIDHAALPVLELASPAFLGSVAAQALAVALLWRTRRPALRLGVLWFYVALLPSLNFVSGYVIYAERFGYVPCIGLAMIAADVAVLVATRIRLPRHAGIALASALAVAACVRSWQRTSDWRDNETLFRAAIETPYASSVVRGFLVDELLRAGRSDEAAQLLGAPVLIAVPRSSAERSALARTALLALQQQDWEHARELLARVTESRFAQFQDYSNLGTALVNLGEHDAARRAFARAEELRPGDPKTARMLGRIALETAQWEEAVRQFERACAAEPEHAEAWYFSAFAAWKARGDAAAIERLGAARRAGVRIAPLYERERARWAGASAVLEAGLRAGD